MSPLIPHNFWFRLDLILWQLNYLLGLHYPVAICVSTVKLFSLGLALHHGIDRFQMRRVGNQGEGDVAVSHTIYSSVVHTQVILHISRALRKAKRPDYPHPQSVAHECRLPIVLYRNGPTSSAASNFESNWQKICSNSLRMTLARTFKRPLERENIDMVRHAMRKGHLIK